MKRFFVFIVLSTLLFSMSGCTQIENNIDNYDDYVAAVSHAGDYMPALDSLGDYIQSAVNYRSHNMLLFKSDSVELFVVYDKEDYKEKKAELLKNYSFLKEAVYDESGKTCLVPETSAVVNGYTIKVVDNRKTDDNYSFPKCFGMVGYSDEMNGIAYMFFTDDDLNFIKSLPEFIEENFVFEAETN